MKTKTMRHIFSHIKQQYPTLATHLERQDEITRFKHHFLTPLQREQIAFIALKNNQLLLAFKHKALCIEFNHYKHKDLMECLKQFKEAFPLLSKVDKIHAYVPSHILNPPTQTIKPPLRFYEHANGDFKNLATNAELRQQFEILRNYIKRIKAENEG